MSESITKNYFENYMAEFRKGLTADFATKEDLKGLATKADIGRLGGQIGTLEGRMGTFEGRMDTLEVQMATKDDIHWLEASMAAKEDIDQLATQMHASFSNLQSSVDRYLKRTEGWYQEFTVLKGKHDKLSGVLVQKGVVTEKDTLL